MLIAVAIGCRQPATTPPTMDTDAQSRPVVLSIEVAGDEEIAEGLRLLSGEWKARSGGEMRVASTSLETFLAADRLMADLVVFPSRLLGALVERGDLRPMRSSVLESEQLAIHDVYPAIRNGEMRYAGQAFALPLGSPPLLTCMDSRLAGAASDELPTTRTWQSLGALRSGAPYAAGVATPRRGRAGAIALIARALSYTEPPRRAEALFNADTFAPGITQPPFVRALREIAEESPATAAEPTGDFTAAANLVRTGKAAAALAWPSLMKGSDGAAQPASLAWAQLPAAGETYSRNQTRWEVASSPRNLVLLGVEGRLIGVTTETRNAVSAFTLAQWLATGDIAVQLSSRSRGTLWFRKSQAGAVAKWMSANGAPSSDELTSAAAAANEALNSDSVVLIPRLLGIDEYLDKLGSAVASAAPSEEAATAELAAAAQAWEAITDRLGRDRQARAYRRHLNLIELQGR